MDITDYEKALDEYREGETSMEIEEFEFSSGDETFKILAWHFGDGSAGFDIFDEEENLHASFLVGAKSTKGLLEFFTEHLTAENWKTDG